MQVQPSGSSVNVAVQPTSTAHRAPQETGGRVPAAGQNERATASHTKETAKEAQDTRSVEEATKRLQDFVSEVRGDIQFSLDNDSGETVVKVVDRVSQEVLRQIPSKEALEIARALDRFQGLLVKQQA